MCCPWPPWHDHQPVGSCDKNTGSENKINELQKQAISQNTIAVQ